MSSIKKYLGSFFIDLLCLLTIVGIWPRFIEPKRLKKTSLKWKISSKHSSLNGLKILHLTDLHFHAQTSSKFLKKIRTEVKEISPDLIFFTGDFICYSQLEKATKLKEFLNSFYAPLGCYCTFGNHDYASYVSRDAKGDYDVLPPINPMRGLAKGLHTLFQSKPSSSAQISDKARSVPFHAQLIDLLKDTPFQLLENECLTLPIGLNVVGFGDYSLGRFHPQKAFSSYDSRYPGILLTHNPDTASSLISYPGNWILAGHTHGEQIHLPFPAFLRNLSRKLTRLENPLYTRGYYQEKDKQLYVNRGLGCHKPIRVFSPPELLTIEVEVSHE